MLRKIDFIAVKYGLKRLMRGHCTLGEFEKINRFCQNQGLFAFLGRDKKIILLNKETAFYVYISKDKKIAQRFANENIEYSNSATVLQLKYFSEVLGYPKCCIDSYLNFGTESYDKKTKKEILFKKIIEKKKNFLLNNFLYDLGFSLSYYQPCSYHCKKASEYNKKILEVVRKEDPDYAVKIEKNLRLPLLIWFDSSQDSDADNFFYKRIQLLFEGAINNSTIYYKNVILYRMYSRCNTSFKES